MFFFNGDKPRIVSHTDLELTAALLPHLQECWDFSGEQYHLTLLWWLGLNSGHHAFPAPRLIFFF